MEITNKNPDRDNVREERQVKIENKYFGTLKPKKGHRCYKYNMSTGKLFELEDEDYFDSEIKVPEPFKLYNKPKKFDNGKPFKIGNFDTSHRKPIKKKESIIRKTKKIIIEQNHIYFTALNADNAIKHINKLYGKR